MIFYSKKISHKLPEETSKAKKSYVTCRNVKIVMGGIKVEVGIRGFGGL